MPARSPRFCAWRAFVGGVRGRARQSASGSTTARGGDGHLDVRVGAATAVARPRGALEIAAARRAHGQPGRAVVRRVAAIAPTAARIAPAEATAAADAL